MNKVLVSVYQHPEYFPPTRSAIYLLAKEYEEVVVLTRNNFNSLKTDYPDNVRFIKIGRYIDLRESERKNIVWKFFVFFKFLLTYQYHIVSSNYKLVLIYDPIPLFVHHLSFKINKMIFWYHNHDILEISLCRKYSIGWFSAKYEHTGLTKMNIFSLPTDDRLKYFPNLGIHQKYFYLPNFPLTEKFEKVSLNTKRSEFTLIFQGAIGPNHGLENILEVMSKQDGINLILKGWSREEYKKQLNKLINDYNLFPRVQWIGFTSYSELIEVSASCHIGIGIHMHNDIMNSTLGTASNKIYEYLALGLPAIVYDNEQFRKNLSEDECVFFYNGNNLYELICKIENDYELISQKARQSFLLKYNFDGYFYKVNQVIKSLETTFQ
jgi:glycosyltransferase involved in cell wall biosynthesis